MFRLVIKDRYVDCELDNASEVANAIFDNTGLWMFASHVKQVCNEAKSGERFEYEDVGVTIECL